MWVKDRLAAVDPHRLNAWTDALDDAIAVLDEAENRGAVWDEIDRIAETLAGIAKRAAAEPEAKDETQAALDAMKRRLDDGTVRRYAEEAARKAEPEVQPTMGDADCPKCHGMMGWPVGAPPPKPEEICDECEAQAKEDEADA